jgi:hypothetical protein
VRIMTDSPLYEDERGVFDNLAMRLKIFVEGRCGGWVCHLARPVLPAMHKAECGGGLQMSVCGTREYYCVCAASSCCVFCFFTDREEIQRLVEREVEMGVVDDTLANMLELLMLDV